MKKSKTVLVVSCILAVFCALATAPSARAKAPKKGKLLYMTLSAGVHHEVVPFSTKIVKQIGEKSGAFDTTVTEDVGAFTSANLKNYDAVMFYTTGELPMTESEKKAFMDFIHSGHGFVGVHSATDTFYMWDDYLKLVGAYFNDHPWHQQVSVEVADPSSPLVSFLGKSFQINDEIYQMSDFQADTSRVLLRLDPNSVDLKNPPPAPPIPVNTAGAALSDIAALTITSGPMLSDMFMVPSKVPSSLLPLVNLPSSIRVAKLFPPVQVKFTVAAPSRSGTVPVQVYVPP